MNAVEICLVRLLRNDLLTHRENKGTGDVYLLKLAESQLIETLSLKMRGSRKQKRPFRLSSVGNERTPLRKTPCRGGIGKPPYEIYGVIHERIFSAHIMFA